MLERKIGVERLADKKRLAHSAAPIDGDKLGTLAFSGVPQHFNLLLSSNHLCISYRTLRGNDTISARYSQ